MRRAYTTTMALLLVTQVCTGAVSAQSGRTDRIPIGSRIPVWEEASSASQTEAARVLHDFAKCITKRKPSHAAAVLAALPDSREHRAAIKALGSWRACLPVGFKMEVKGSLFRGALAEAIYLRSAPMAPALSPRPMAFDFESLAARLSAADASGVDEEDKALLTVRWMSYCAAHENPLAVDSLLRTTIGSEAETLALRELRPTLPACLFSGHEAVIARLPLRALMAEALYQFYMQGNSADRVSTDVGSRQ